MKKKLNKEKKESEKQSRKEISTDMFICNNRDDIFLNDTSLESHLLKRHEAENDFKFVECVFMCAGLMTLLRVI